MNLDNFFSDLSMDLDIMIDQIQFNLFLIEQGEDGCDELFEEELCE